MIRESERVQGTYVLSVRDKVKRTRKTVKHYRISHSDQNGFSINGQASFRSLPELVEYYRKFDDGLCCQLRKHQEVEDKIIISEDRHDLWEADLELIETTKDSHQSLKNHEEMKDEQIEKINFLCCQFFRSSQTKLSKVAHS